MTNEMILKLRDAAAAAREYAYVPFSKFKVGAALLTEDGKIFTGCNVENASYGLTNCAERTAIFKAVSEGYTKFQAIAVIAECPQAVAPCGACRQVIAEFLIPVIYSWNTVGDLRTMTLDELIPHYFSGADFVK